MFSEITTEIETNATMSAERTKECLVAALTSVKRFIENFDHKDCIKTESLLAELGTLRIFYRVSAFDINTLIKGAFPNILLNSNLFVLDLFRKTCL